MSGHSHFKTVKATKDANDAKRGKIFSKLGRVITIAVKDKGSDLSTNAALKAAVEKAREFNMPKENIERAIKRGSGEAAGESLQEVVFEGFGPGGISFIIEGITDNKNRTLGEIKTILGQHDAKIASEGAVKWMFERKGFIVANNPNGTPEESELMAIEAGADDIKTSGTLLYIYTKPEDLEKVKKILTERALAVQSASLDWIAKEEISITDREKKEVERLFEELDENDAVQNIYSNIML